MEKINTCYSIDVKVYRMIEKLAGYHSISKAEYIRSVLNIGIMSEQSKLIRHSAVKYQPACPSGIMIVRITLDRETYEIVNILRYSSRQSVSLIIRNVVIEEYHKTIRVLYTGVENFSVNIQKIDLARQGKKEAICVIIFRMPFLGNNSS